MSSSESVPTRARYRLVMSLYCTDGLRLWPNKLKNFAVAISAPDVDFLRMNKQAPKSGDGSSDLLMVYFRTLNQESERGKILLLAGKIDELLCQLLQTFFKPHRGKKSDDKLFMPMGPLGSFSSRIEMAYRVGLISKTSADCLDILRDIRNKGAHKIEPFSYENGKYSESFKNFKKLTCTISEMDTFARLVKRIDATQGSTSKEAIFLLLALVHMLMLQSTLARLQTVGDSFANLKNADWNNYLFTLVPPQPQ